MGHVFDAAKGIASVFQQRAAHCALCWFDSSDSSDSNDFCKAICGRVERSKQFEISDSLGFAFTAELFVFLSFSFAGSSTLVGRRSKPVLVDLAAVSLLLSPLFFVQAS